MALWIYDQMTNKEFNVTQNSEHSLELVDTIPCRNLLVYSRISQ